MVNFIKIFLKLKFREIITIIFSITIPLLSTYISIVIFGNKSIGNGFSLIDIYFVNGILFSILSLSYFSLSMDIVRRYETNQEIRLKYFGINNKKIIINDLIIYAILTFLVILINILASFIGYGLKIPTLVYFISYILHIMYASIPLYLISIFISKFVKKSQNLMIIIMPFFALTSFFSGITVPLQILDSVWVKIAEYNPLYLCVISLSKIWMKLKYFDEKFIITNTIYILIFLALIYIQKRYFELKKK